MADERTQVMTTHSNQPGNSSIRDDFTAPLDTTTGRLIFASGAANVHILAHAEPSLLYTAHFEQHIPSVRVQDGIVTVQYRHYPLFGWLVYRNEPLAQIALNSTIPWEIEFRHGVSRLRTDLRNIQLCSLDLGSVSTSRIALPVPAGAANIYLSGSASNLTLQRPPGVAIRLQIAGSASRLSLDHQRFGAISGGIQWQTPDYHDAVNHYDIDIAGSVSNMTISTY